MSNPSKNFGRNNFIVQNCKVASIIDTAETLKVSKRILLGNCEKATPFATTVLHYIRLRPQERPFHFRNESHKSLFTSQFLSKTRNRRAPRARETADEAGDRRRRLRRWSPPHPDF